MNFSIHWFWVAKTLGLFCFIAFYALLSKKLIREYIYKGMGMGTDGTIRSFIVSIVVMIFQCIACTGFFLGITIGFDMDIVVLCLIISIPISLDELFKQRRNFRKEFRK